MRAIPSGRQIAARAQVGVKKDVQQMFRDVVSEMSATIQRYADSEGKIPRQQRDAMREDVLLPLRRAFIGATGRQVFDEKGLAVTGFARVLQRWYVYAVVEMVKLQRSWMKQNIPEDVYRWLSLTPRRTLQQEAANPYEQRDGESREEYRARLIRDLRIVHDNPLAQIDPSRQWVPFTEWQDERGYVLSDRVWNADNETRRKIDALLAEGLRQNRSALDLAKALEAYLVPTQTGIRTLKPYGPSWRPDGAAYAAMRLARTEISRAANQAAFMSALMNPYVDKIDVARSGNGDPNCPVCPQHATIDRGGGRLREPYDLNAAYIGPYHSHCMCTARGVVTDSPQTITQNIQALMEFDPTIQPAPTAATDLMIESLLGAELMALWRNNQL